MARDFMPTSGSLMPYIVANRDGVVASVSRVNNRIGDVNLDDTYVRLATYNAFADDVSDVVVNLQDQVNSNLVLILESAKAGDNNDITSLNALSSTWKIPVANLPNVTGVPYVNKNGSIAETVSGLKTFTTGVNVNTSTSTPFNVTNANGSFTGIGKNLAILDTSYSGVARKALVFRKNLGDVSEQVQLNFPTMSHAYTGTIHTDTDQLVGSIYAIKDVNLTDLMGTTFSFDNSAVNIPTGWTVGGTIVDSISGTKRTQLATSDDGTLMAVRAGTVSYANSGGTSVPVNTAWNGWQKVGGSSTVGTVTGDATYQKVGNIITQTFNYTGTVFNQGSPKTTIGGAQWFHDKNSITLPQPFPTKMLSVQATPQMPVPFLTNGREIIIVPEPSFNDNVGNPATTSFTMRYLVSDTAVDVNNTQFAPTFFITVTGY